MRDNAERYHSRLQALEERGLDHKQSEPGYPGQQNHLGQQNHPPLSWKDQQQQQQQQDPPQQHLGQGWNEGSRQRGRFAQQQQPRHQLDAFGAADNFGIRDGGDDHYHGRAFHFPNEQQQQQQQQRSPSQRRYERGMANIPPHHQPADALPGNRLGEEEGGAGRQDEALGGPKMDGVGEHEGPGGGERQQGEQHLSEEQRRAVYDSLHAKAQRGEQLEEKQQQLYQLLSRRYGANKSPPPSLPRPHPPGGQNPLEPPWPRGQEEPAAPQQQQDHPEPVIQQPPNPEGVAGGIPNNNEQEEVKDLIDGGGGGGAGGGGGGAGGGQQKQEAFDNVKEPQVEGVPVGGAGGPNDPPDDGVELQEGAENGHGRDDPLPKPVQDDNHAQPLNEPVQEGNGRGGLNDDNEDDAVDYGVAGAHGENREAEKQGNAHEVSLS